jgi:glucose/mannose-6-phosphate isomerase
MKEIIRTYNTQFKFIPQIVNEHLIKKNYKQIVLCGMGGSHLPAGILKTIEPGIDIYVHKDYDMPPYSKSFLESSLLIASSHSGNTEEVISFYKKTKQLYDLPVLCISTGGELIDLAQKNNDPYIVLLQTDFVPRTALGISTLALASVLKDKNIYYKIQNLILDIDEIEKNAIDIYQKFNAKVPIFYASNQNLHLAYNWKIKFNETAKQASFYNVFPESNHNEIESYEFMEDTQSFMPCLIRDTEDHPRIQKRFDVFEEILKEKNIPYIVLDISHSDVCQKAFKTIVLGDFVTGMLAEEKGVPQAEVPLIEDFKKRLI